MSNGRLLLWGFKPPSELAQNGLGSLEKQVLDVVWRDGQVTVRDVHAALGSDIAYTTVMTTMKSMAAIKNYGKEPSAKLKKLPMK